MSFIEFVLDNDSCFWNWSDLSANPNIFFEDVLRNPEQPWDYIELSRNPNITLDIVDSHPEISWNYSGLTKNPNITLDIIKRRCDIPWDKNELSKNPSITWECIQSNPYIKWDYYYISQNSNITWDIITKNRNLFINHGKQISNNPNISWDIVTRLDNHMDWDYITVMGNPAITFYDVYESLIIGDGESMVDAGIPNSNVSFRLCLYGLSKNPNVTWDMVHSEEDEFKEIKWNNYFLCMNPNVTIKVLKENPHFRYYTVISKNEMDYYPWHLVKSHNSSPYILK
jgi:hypothetical protein